MNLYDYHSSPDILQGYANRMYHVPELALELAINGDQKAINHIKFNPKAAFEYAMHNNDRFPAAEPYILKDLYWAYNYIMAFHPDFPNKRWPEAENLFKTDPSYAFNYA